MPNIILIAESYEITAAPARSLIEVPGRTGVSLVYVNLYRKWRAAGEVPKQRNGGVRRSVVAYDNFVRAACLAGNAFKLLW